MENWGLLTYRETALLVDEAAQDIKQEFYIALVVSHEVGVGGGCGGGRDAGC
jgi:aminopeptidase N